MSRCIRTQNIYQEATGHCRWKTVLQSVIDDINISDYNNKSFEEIVISINSICKDIKGLGPLTIYDLSAAICRFYKINIDRVYIVGNGPKRAMKLLGLKTETHKINDKIKMKYVNISDIIEAFDKKSYKLDESLRDKTDGDIFETYICNWQKNIT